MAETVQKNFRMSPRAIKLLHSVARAQGITETDVVEYCVSKYALEMGHDVDRAKELLFQQICASAAKSPAAPVHPRGMASAETGREGPREATAATGNTAAGALASMVGEKWSEEKKGKKKS
jgi:hypothetical protein